MNAAEAAGAARRESRVNVKKLATLAMLTCISFVVMWLSKLIPLNVAGILSFDLKDVVIVIAGFIYGPLAAAGVSVVVSLLEMVTVSSTGPVGMVMNILSTCAFACTASYIYKRTRSQRGAILGLCAGVVAMTAVMLLWNYIVTPSYMHVDRSLVVSMLLPVFMPFNLIKSGICSVLAMLIYKPVVGALRRARLLPESDGARSGGKVGVIAVSAVLLVTLVLLALALAGAF